MPVDLRLVENCHRRAIREVLALSDGRPFRQRDPVDSRDSDMCLLEALGYIPVLIKIIRSGAETENE